jgi:glutaredoxin
MNVIIYTRRECPLCEKGIDLTERVFGAGHVALVDVDLDLELMKRYTDRVPVIETEDGVVIDEGTITESTLREFSFRR